MSLADRIVEEGPGRFVYERYGLVYAALAIIFFIVPIYLLYSYPLSGPLVSGGNLLALGLMLVLFLVGLFILRSAKDFRITVDKGLGRVTTESGYPFMPRKAETFPMSDIQEILLKDRYARTSRRSGRISANIYIRKSDNTFVHVMVREIDAARDIGSRLARFIGVGVREEEVQMRHG